MIPRPWYDSALLLYLVLFFLVEAAVIIRESRLGWSMFFKCLSLAATFLYGYVLAFVTVPSDVLMAIRVALCVSLTGAVNEMLYSRTHWPVAVRAAVSISVLVIAVVVTQILYALYGYPH